MISLKLLSILTISRPGKYINMKHIPAKPALYLKLTTRPFLEGKYIDIYRMADPDKPFQNGRLKYSAHIRIYDVFGFFASSFSAVVDSMVQSGRATDEEAAFIREMKGRRENFASEDIDQIQKYTATELRLLARMMTDVRKGFAETGLHLRDWHGAGAAAAALIEAKNLKAHYGPDIAASNITP